MGKFDKDFWTRNLVTKGWQLFSEGWSFQKRGCQRRFWGCLTFILLLILFACGLLFLVVDGLSAGSLSAASIQNAESLHVFLLIDNSNSMFEKDGLGSDPGLLRIDAARLFITYLGVDNGRFTHECGVIFFGTQPETILPLLPLNADEQRTAMFTQIQSPPRMGWTDQIAAIRHAQNQLEAVAGQPVVIMLTDGKPEWGYTPTQAEREAYVAELQQVGEELAVAEIPVFIILLSNSATAADPEIAQIWQPIWQTMVHGTPTGQFFHAREAIDLMGIYHEIVVALTSNQSSGAVVQGQIEAGGLNETIPVEPDLARMTLVISKSSSDISVTIVQPNGRSLHKNLPGVNYAGGTNVASEEIWSIANPPTGNWAVQATGAGAVTVWKDYRLAPTPISPHTATTVPPTSTITVTPTVPPPTIHKANVSADPQAVVEQPDLDTTPALSAAEVAVSPTPAPSLSVTSTTPKSWPWLLGGGILIGLLSFGFYQYRNKHLVPLSGELLLISGPKSVRFDNRILLDSFNKPFLKLGKPPADIEIAACSVQVTLTTLEHNGHYSIHISGPQTVLLNERPLNSPAALYDNDLITLGKTHLRYQNLRLRRPNEDLRSTVGRITRQHLQQDLSCFSVLATELIL